MNHFKKKKSFQIVSFISNEKNKKKMVSNELVSERQITNGNKNEVEGSKGYKMGPRGNIRKVF